MAWGSPSPGRDSSANGFRVLQRWKRMVGWVPRANCVDRGRVIGTAGGAEGTGEPRVRVVAQGAVPDATGSN